MSGLSTGLVKAGVADVRWAVENDPSAAQAFRLNHPLSTVYTEDCNSILQRIMDVSTGHAVPHRQGHHNDLQTAMYSSMS